MVEDDYWDYDWGESNDVPAVKEAKARKAARKHRVGLDSSSVAQRMKARRAPASFASSGGVVGIVNFDDRDEPPQGGDATTMEKERQEVEDPAHQPAATEPEVCSKSKKDGSEPPRGSSTRPGHSC